MSRPRSPLTPFLGANPRADADAALLWRWLAVGLCGLLGVTKSLWLPQSSYPQIPFLELARKVPQIWDVVLLTIVVTASLLLFCLADRRRFAIPLIATIAIGLTSSIFLNQQRLQPWAYQFVILCAFFTWLPARTALASVRLLTISIYIYSAISKCDASFFQTHGQVLMTGFLSALQLPTESRPPILITTLTVMLPLGELFVAIALCVSKTRRFGLVAGVFLHFALLLTLSPLGLDHQPGVLIWNVFFIGLLFILFRQSAFGQQADTEADSSPVLWKSRIAFTILAATVLLPLLHPWGLFDAWPSWAVYASQPERMTITINSAARDRLPPELRRHTHPVLQSKDEFQLRIDRWSLETLSAPLPPSMRIQLAVAFTIADRFQLGDNIVIELKSAANRFTGTRSVEQIKGSSAIAEKLKSFRLNTTSRGCFSLEVPQRERVAF